VGTWNVVFYETEEGVCEVLDFLEGRKESAQAKAIAWINKLEQEGPQLPRPYADILRDGIHELRIKMSGDQVRVLYFFIHKDVIVLTHSFIKNTSAVPESEINKAIQIQKDFLKRFPKREALNEILKKSPPRKTGK
jgi:phage-related protein